MKKEIEQLNKILDEVSFDIRSLESNLNSVPFDIEYPIDDDHDLKWSLHNRRLILITREGTSISSKPFIECRATERIKYHKILKSFEEFTSSRIKEFIQQFNKKH